MPMTAEGLQAAILAVMPEGTQLTHDNAVLQLATAIVTYIQTNAVVEVPGVMPGSGAAVGTIS